VLLSACFSSFRFEIEFVVGGISLVFRHIVVAAASQSTRQRQRQRHRSVIVVCVDADADNVCAAILSALEQSPAKLYIRLLFAVAQWDASGRHARRGGPSTAGPQNCALRVQLVLSGEWQRREILRLDLHNMLHSIGAVYDKSVPASDCHTEGRAVRWSQNDGGFYVLRRGECVPGAAAAHTKNGRNAQDQGSRRDAHRSGQPHQVRQQVIQWGYRVAWPSWCQCGRD